MNSAAQPEPDEESPDAAAAGVPAAAANPAAVSWGVLAAHVEEFLAAWESGNAPPQITDHLPADDRILRQMILAELIKIDLEFRYSGDHDILRLEDYIAEHQEFADPGGIPADLIFEEFHVRKSHGIAPDADEYLARFPQQAGALARLLDIDAPTFSSSLSGSQAVESFAAGDRIDDFYLMSELGKGAFGSVYLARQESMQRLVALKISRDRGTEAMTLAQLDHPHIVRVHDQHRLPDRNLRLLYMQFAAGGTLQSVIQLAKSSDDRTGDLVGRAVAESLNATGVISPTDVPLRPELAGRPWPEVACRLGMELARALSYAHSQGILHRDVKPANVLLDAAGSAKLADFNISFSSNLNSGGAAAYFGGSLAYMSPEQLEACNPGHPRQPTELDGRSDIYSLGVLIWELLFGERPFADAQVQGGWSESIEQMTALRRLGPPSAPAVPRDDTGQELLRILRTCLQPDVDKRFANANELAQNLGLCLQPRVARLLRKHDEGLSGIAVRHPLIAVTLATMIPNGLAGAFNYAYNNQAIVEKLTSRRAADAFDVVQFVINATAFPIGLFGALIFALPVIRALRCLPAQPANASSETARQRSLLLGTFAAGLGIGLWFISGFAYPLSLHAIIGEFPVSEYAHFFGSGLICGMIAAAYPFFLLLWLAVRGFFPALLRDRTLTSADTATLTSVNGQTGWLLYLAGSVPAVGMLMLLATADLDETHNRFALTVLSAVGAIGFAAAFGLYRTLQDDIAAWLEATRLTEEAE